MGFPSASEREAQYRICGEVMANTANGIGLPIDDVTADRWGDTMARLATADDISEATPEAFSDPAILVQELGLDTDQPCLVDAASGLLDANTRSSNSSVLADHFAARRDEAKYSMDLLRFQSPNSNKQPAAWQELEGLCITGIYLDSLFDAIKDAKRLQHFTASQLAIGSLKHFARSLRALQPETIVSFQRAAHRVGMDRYILTKPKRLASEILQRAA